MHLVARSLNFLVLLSVALLVTRSANADSAAPSFTPFYILDQVYGLSAASPHLGIVAGSVYYSANFSPPIPSGGFYLPVVLLFFQDAYSGGGYLGPTTGPTTPGLGGPGPDLALDPRTYLASAGSQFTLTGLVTFPGSTPSVSDLRTFVIPPGTPPGLYPYLYDVEFVVAHDGVIDGASAPFTIDVAAVSEPSSLVLLLSAFAVLALTFLRRMARVAQAL